LRRPLSLSIFALSLFFLFLSCHINMLLGNAVESKLGSFTNLIRERIDKRKNIIDFYDQGNGVPSHQTCVALADHLGTTIINIL
jgi:hypothetical protein